MHSGCLLAFDFGLRHIGVATGQFITKTATGIATLDAKDGNPLWEEMSTLVKAWEPSIFLVGLPLNMDDTESEISIRARRFAGKLIQNFNLPTEMVDERLTTREALSTPTKNVHEAAAVLIAESWLYEQ